MKNIQKKAVALFVPSLCQRLAKGDRREASLAHAREPLIRSKKAVALFIPLFTILYIIALFSLSTVFLTEKINTLSGGIGGEAAHVQSQLWRVETERALQAQELKETLCTALDKALENLPNDIYTKEKLLPTLEEQLQKKLQEQRPNELTGITSNNPLTIVSTPRQSQQREQTLTLYSTGAEKKELSMIRPTKHAFTTITGYDLTRWELVHAHVRAHAQQCSQEPTKKTQNACMKELPTRSNLPNPSTYDLKIITRTENPSLDKHTYQVRIIAFNPPRGCTQGHTLTYIITLPTTMEPEEPETPVQQQSTSTPVLA